MTDIDSIAGRGRRAHGAPGPRRESRDEEGIRSPKKTPLAGPLAEVIQEPGSLSGRVQGPAGGRHEKGVRQSMLRGLLTITIVATLALAPTISYARDLVWEAWGENACAGSASEGTHAWVTRGLYDRGRELGLGPWGAAGAAMALMTAWEVYEVKEMDSLGVSVQDLTANAAGILTGMVGLDLNYQFAAFADPPYDDEHPWLNVPCIPRNDMSYCLEIGRNGWSLGYKFIGQPGDIAIGTTTMPVLASEEGDFESVPYVGRSWDSGWHAAVGMSTKDSTPVAGGGYRVVSGLIGVDISGLASRDGLGLGASIFVGYDGLF